MAELLIQRKLESLHRCVMRIEARCPDTVAELEGNLDLQDILVLNITRAVQLCVDLAMHRLSQLNEPVPETMGSAFEALARRKLLDTELAERLRKAVGFRNIAVHNYEVINWAIVHAIATRYLDDFAQFARAMLADAQ